MIKKTRTPSSEGVGQPPKKTKRLAKLGALLLLWGEPYQHLSPPGSCESPHLLRLHWDESASPMYEKKQRKIRPYYYFTLSQPDIHTQKISRNSRLKIMVVECNAKAESHPVSCVVLNKCSYLFTAIPNTLPYRIPLPTDH